MQKEIKDYFVKPDDAVLKQIALPIPIPEINSPATQEIIHKMLEIAYGKQQNVSRPYLVGLAAPQIGISRRIIIVDLQQNTVDRKTGQPEVFINPEITWKSKEEWEWREGCFSAGPNVMGIVKRPVSVKICALTRLGEEVEIQFDNYPARICQHEIDHLDGIEFVERVLAQNPDNLHWVKEDEFMKYRENEAWRTWPKKCSRAKWEQIKGIK